MKYDILYAFRAELGGMVERENTGKTYFAALEKLFRDVQFDELSQLDKDWILKEMAEKFKTKNEFSAAKNALIRLKAFDDTLNLPTEEEFRAISSKKRNFGRRPKKVIYLKPTQRKINQIPDERLKYGYRLAMASGLRIFEIAALEAGDIVLSGSKIFVNVRDGKGGESAVVECREDAYLSERLPEFLKRNPTGKLFYTADFMKHYAADIDIECHDLRRIFAITLRDELKKQMPIEEANQIVQTRMRHARFSTTKRYLFNRKLKLEYDMEKAPEVTEGNLRGNSKGMQGGKDYKGSGISGAAERKQETGR